MYLYLFQVAGKDEKVKDGVDGEPKKNEEKVCHY